MTDITKLGGSAPPATSSDKKRRKKKTPASPLAGTQGRGGITPLEVQREVSALAGTSGQQVAPDTQGYLPPQTLPVLPPPLEHGVEGYVPQPGTVATLDPDIEASLRAATGMVSGHIDKTLLNLTKAHYEVFGSWPSWSLTADLLDSGEVEFPTYEEALIFFQNVKRSFAASGKEWQLDAQGTDNLIGASERAKGTAGFGADSDLLDPEMIASWKPKSVDDFLFGPYVKKVTDSGTTMARQDRLRLDELLIALPRQWAISNLSDRLSARSLRFNPDRDEDEAMMLELNQYLRDRVPGELAPAPTAAWQNKTEEGLRYLQMMRAGALYVASNGEDEDAAAFLHTQGYSDIISTLEEQIRMPADPTGRADEAKRAWVQDWWVRSRNPGVSERQAVHELADINVNAVTIEGQRLIGSDHLAGYAGAIAGWFEDVPVLEQIGDIVRSEEFQTVTRPAIALGSEIAHVVGPTIAIPVEAFAKAYDFWDVYRDAFLATLRDDNAISVTAKMLIEGPLAFTHNPLFAERKANGDIDSAWSQWVALGRRGQDDSFDAALGDFIDQFKQNKERREQGLPTGHYWDAVLNDWGVNPTTHPELAFLAQFAGDTLIDFVAFKGLGLAGRALLRTPAGRAASETARSVLHQETVADTWVRHLHKNVGTRRLTEEEVGKESPRLGMETGTFNRKNYQMAMTEMWGLDPNDAVTMTERLYAAYRKGATDDVLRQMVRDGMNHTGDPKTWMARSGKNRLDADSWGFHYRIREKALLDPESFIYRQKHPFISRLLERQFNTPVYAVDRKHWGESVKQLGFGLRTVLTPEKMGDAVGLARAEAIARKDWEMLAEVEQAAAARDVVQLTRVLGGHVIDADDVAIRTIRELGEELTEENVTSRAEAFVNQMGEFYGQVTGRRMLRERAARRFEKRFWKTHTEEAVSWHAMAKALNPKIEDDFLPKGAEYRVWEDVKSYDRGAGRGETLPADFGAQGISDGQLYAPKHGEGKVKVAVHEGAEPSWVANEQSIGRAYDELEPQIAAYRAYLGLDPNNGMPEGLKQILARVEGRTVEEVNLELNAVEAATKARYDAAITSHAEKVAKTVRELVTMDEKYTYLAQLRERAEKRRAAVEELKARGVKDPKKLRKARKAADKASEEEAAAIVMVTREQLPLHEASRAVVEEARAKVQAAAAEAQGLNQRLQAIQLRLEAGLQLGSRRPTEQVEHGLVAEVERASHADYLDAVAEKQHWNRVVALAEEMGQPLTDAQREAWRLMQTVVEQRRQAWRINNERLTRSRIALSQGRYTGENAPRVSLRPYEAESPGETPLDLSMPLDMPEEDVIALTPPLDVQEAALDALRSGGNERMREVLTEWLTNMLHGYTKRPDDDPRIVFSREEVAAMTRRMGEEARPEIIPPAPVTATTSRRLDELRERSLTLTAKRDRYAGYAQQAEETWIASYTEKQPAAVVAANYRSYQRHKVRSSVYDSHLRSVLEQIAEEERRLGHVPSEGERVAIAQAGPFAERTGELPGGKPSAASEKYRAEGGKQLPEGGEEAAPAVAEYDEMSRAGLDPLKSGIADEEQLVEVMADQAFNDAIARLCSLAYRHGGSLTIRMPRIRWQRNEGRSPATLYTRGAEEMVESGEFAGNIFPLTTQRGGRGWHRVPEYETYTVMEKVKKGRKTVEVERTYRRVKRGKDGQPVWKVERTASGRIKRRKNKETGKLEPVYVMERGPVGGNRAMERLDTGELVPETPALETAEQAPRFAYDEMWGQFTGDVLDEDLAVSSTGWYPRNQPVYADPVTKTLYAPGLNSAERLRLFDALREQGLLDDPSWQITAVLPDDVPLKSLQRVKDTLIRGPYDERLLNLTLAEMLGSVVDDALAKGHYPPLVAQRGTLLSEQATLRAQRLGLIDPALARGIRVVQGKGKGINVGRSSSGGEFPLLGNPYVPAKVNGSITRQTVDDAVAAYEDYLRQALDENAETVIVTLPNGTKQSVHGDHIRQQFDELVERVRAGENTLLCPLKDHKKGRCHAEVLAERVKKRLRGAEATPAETSPKRGARLPVTGKYTAKDQAKADIATKFIGRGSARSSTAKYAQAFGNRANSGVYSADDIVFISSEGTRNGRLVPDYKEIDKAIAARAQFVTDDIENANRAYNIGEREVRKYLEDHGYRETEPGNGHWVSTAKPEQPKTAPAAADQPLLPEDILSAPELGDLYKEADRISRSTAFTEAEEIIQEAVGQHPGVSSQTAARWRREIEARNTLQPDDATRVLAPEETLGMGADELTRAAVPVVDDELLKLSAAASLAQTEARSAEYRFLAAQRELREAELELHASETAIAQNIARLNGGTAREIDPAEIERLREMINWLDGGATPEEVLSRATAEFDEHDLNSAMHTLWMLEHYPDQALRWAVQPSREWHLRLYGSMGYNPARVAKFFAGGVIKKTESMWANKIFLKRWSIDDMVTLYKVIVMSKISTMLRITMADEATRLISEGINPYTALKDAKLLKNLDKLPEDIQFKLSEMIGKSIDGKAAVLEMSHPKAWYAYRHVLINDRRDPTFVRYLYGKQLSAEERAAQVQRFLAEADPESAYAQIVQEYLRHGDEFRAWYTLGYQPGGGLRKVGLHTHTVLERNEKSDLSLQSGSTRYEKTAGPAANQYADARNPIDHLVSDYDWLTEHKHLGADWKPQRRFTQDELDAFERGELRMPSDITFDNGLSKLGDPSKARWRALQKYVRDHASEPDIERRIPAIAGWTDGSVTGGIPGIRTARDVFYRILDYSGSKLNEMVFSQAWKREKDSLVARGVEELAAERQAFHYAREYTHRVMFNNATYMGEEMLRNVLLFLPAYRQFVQYWVPYLAKHPFALSLAYRANRDKEQLQDLRVGPVSLDVSRMSFLINQGDNRITGWLPGGSPLITMPVSYMVRDADKASIWGSLAGNWPLEYAEPGMPLHSPLDKMWYGLTGRTLPWPFGSDPTRNPWRELQIVRSAALKGKEVSGDEAHWINRMNRFKEGGWNFLMPVGMRFIDGDVQKMQELRTAYNQASSPEEVEALLSDPANATFKSFIEWQNKPSWDQLKYLKEHPEILPYMVSGYEGRRTNETDIAFLWSKMRDIGVADPAGYVKRLDEKTATINRVIEAIDLRKARDREVAWWERYKREHEGDHDIARLQNAWQNSTDEFAPGGVFYQQGWIGYAARNEDLNGKYAGISDPFTGISAGEDFDSDAYRFAKLLDAADGPARHLLQMSPNYDMYVKLKLDEHVASTTKLLSTWRERRMTTRLTGEEIKAAGYTPEQTAKLQKAVRSIDDLWDAADAACAKYGKYGYATTEGRAIRKKALEYQNSLIESSPLLREFLGDNITSMYGKSYLTKPAYQREDLIRLDEMDAEERESFYRLVSEKDPETGKPRWDGLYLPEGEKKYIEGATVLGYVPTDKGWMTKVRVGEVTGLVKGKVPKEGKDVLLTFERARQLVIDFQKKRPDTVAAEAKWLAAIKESLPAWARRLVQDEVRAAAWRAWLEAARMERHNLRTTINEYYSDAPGFSLNSKFGMRVKKRLLAYGKLLGQFEPTFDREYRELNANNEMINAILGWYL